MVFSFFVAVVIAPWLMVRFARKTLHAGAAHHDEGKLGALYRKVASRVIGTRRSAWTFLIGVGEAPPWWSSAFATKTVTVKLLPFDKCSSWAGGSTFEGTSLEATQRALADAAIVTPTDIPQGQVGIVEARDGNALPVGRIIAKGVSCDSY